MSRLVVFDCGSGSSEYILETEGDLFDRKMDQIDRLLNDAFSGYGDYDGDGYGSRFGSELGVFDREIDELNSLLDEIMEKDSDDVVLDIANDISRLMNVAIANLDDSVKKINRIIGIYNSVDTNETRINSDELDEVIESCIDVVEYAQERFQDCTDELDKVTYDLKLGLIGESAKSDKSDKSSAHCGKCKCKDKK